ncbi:MAG TPA: MBL fold metallo-hydrolase [Chryseolinea sp.]|nr:MBL fold metallo-hydrolase [Chryseolinea sp.]
MSLFVASLNSGSNGNCYYVGNNDEAVLIDGGISCRETEKRLKRLGLSIKKIKGVFVSHEHGDHIHGVSSLSKKHQIPVYITPRTLQNGNLAVRQDRVFTIRSNEPLHIGGLTILAFPKLHDACDPHSFMISSNSVKVGIFTDIGLACDNVIQHFRQCHAAFLESNYDETMLEQGRYPLSLKNRIRGGMGHLSNKQAMQLFITHRAAYLTHLFLVHLSQNNNHPKIVKDTFYPVAGQTQIVIASRERETKLFHIRSVEHLYAKATRVPERFAEQLSIF